MFKMKPSQIFVIFVTYIIAGIGIADGHKRYKAHNHVHQEKRELSEDYSLPNTINSQGSLRRQINDSSDLDQQSRGIFGQLLSKVMEFTSNKLYNAVRRNGNQIKFILFNLQNTQNGEVFTPNAPNKASIWDYNAYVKILIHGYRDSVSKGRTLTSYGTESMPISIKNDYIKARRTENIIAVDWQSLSAETNYFNSAKNTKLVGELIADFILALKKHDYLYSFKDVHIIGFSLGAQTAGVAGFFVKKKSGGNKIARITGLDPAGPGFEPSMSLDDRLDATDADFVDVIHCDLGKSTDGHYGTELVSGSVDFYPNGGTFQPNCPAPPLVINLVTGSCSHNYCPQLFRQSILGKSYRACRCTDWSSFQKGECRCNNGPLMGDPCDSRIRGKYYLQAVV